jgi:hypothetical protein
VLPQPVPTNRRASDAHDAYVTVRPVFARAIPPTLAALAVASLWPAQWYLECGDECFVSDTTATTGVPLPNGALAPVPALLIAAVVAVLARLVARPRAHLGRLLVGTVGALLVASLAVLALYPATWSNDCSAALAIEDPCITKSVSTLGVALPDTGGYTLGLAVLASCALWAVLALVYGSWRARASERATA